MSPGQKRAVRELQRLCAASNGGVDFLCEPESGTTPLIVMVSLRIGTLENRQGGLEFRERETFYLLIWPDFPFQRPLICVDHDRFAGFPHVIWTKVLCLYQTDLEWNPSAGLYGFFDRLNLWLSKASMNDMDPVGGPLEPPHHVTDFSQLPMVVRANAPVNAGNSWLGYAVLEKYSNRTELVEWRTLSDDWPAGKLIAFAAMLPEALPMEFPKNGATLFSHFEKQGFTPAQIVRYLAFAALLTPVGESGYFVVGLPMRRAADGTPKIHIAAWSIKAIVAENLRMLLGNDTEPEAIKALRKQMEDTILKIISESEISWCRIMDDRSEIAMRRDNSRPLAWYRGKRVLILGCGALGSWAGEMVVRAGVAAIDLLDNGVVKPGLLVRQNYTTADIAANKAVALSGRLKTIALPETIIQSFDSEAHSFCMADLVRLAAYDVVLDCTASNITQMKLERDWRTLRGCTPPFVSVVTDAEAQRALCVVTVRNAITGPWDSFVRLKHRLCIDGRMPEIQEAFYGDNATKHLFQPEPGCSDPTFAGSGTDASLLVASALNLSAAYGLIPQTKAAIAYSAPSPGSHPTEVIACTEMDEYVSGDYRVRIARNVAVEARAWVRQNNRLRTPDHETGGLVWGFWDDALRVIWIFDISGPPSDSRHDPGHFLCGVDGTLAEHQHRVAISRGTSGFIGFWHTHPDLPSTQSRTDLVTMAELVSSLGLNQQRALMLIYGRSGEHPTAGIYVYESQSAGNDVDYVTVGVAQAVLDKGVV